MSKLDFREIRITLGLTLSDLAREAKISEKTIRDIERGKREGRDVTRSRMINALNKLADKNYNNDDFFDTNDRTVS